MFADPPARPKQSPIEEPSPGELAVLRYLATDLSQREIGARRYVSLNTEAHTRELYRKLGSVFVLSLTAVLNPTLLVAVTLMLTLPSTIAATETP